MNSSSVILYSADGKVLLQERENHIKVFPGMFCLFGGGIESGESPLDCIVRESMEELKYKLKNPKFFTEKRDAISFNYVYLEKYDCSQKLILGEGASMQWVKKEWIEALNVVPYQREAIYEFYKSEILNSQT